MTPFLGTGKVECISNGDVTVHWWPGEAKAGDPCRCGARTWAAKPGRTTMPPQVNERWRYKPNRGSGMFTVVRVSGDRVYLRDEYRGREKRINLRTLRGDYERVSS